VSDLQRCPLGPYGAHQGLFLASVVLSLSTGSTQDRIKHVSRGETMNFISKDLGPYGAHQAFKWYSVKVFVSFFSLMQNISQFSRAHINKNWLTIAKCKVNITGINRH